MKKLILLGTGGNNADILEAIAEINALRPTYEVLGYVRQDGHRLTHEKLPFLGDFNGLQHIPKDVQIAGFTFGVNSFRSWPDFITQLGLSSDRFETIIHPRAYVSASSKIGHGSVILAGTTLGANVTIGNHVIILQNVGLSHDDVIEDFSCITVGVAFSGSVQVGRNCFIGTHATITASLGEGSLIGAGTLIRQKVPPNEVWVGNPGRFLRQL